MTFINFVYVNAIADVWQASYREFGHLPLSKRCDLPIIQSAMPDPARTAQSGHEGAGGRGPWLWLQA